MMMTNEEIVKSFHEAKDKRGQVRILAELNACSTGEIKEILEAAGQEVPRRAYKRRSSAQVAADESRSEKMKARKKAEREEKTVEKQDFVSKVAEALRVEPGEGPEQEQEQEPEAVATSQQTDGLPNEVLEVLTEKMIEITEQIDALTKRAQAIRDFITARTQ